MKRYMLTGAAALVLLIGPARADIIDLFATVDGGAPAHAQSVTGTLNVINAALGPFTLNTVNATSQSVLPPPGILDTNSLNLQQTNTGSHQLILDIIASQLTGPNVLANILSSFSVSGLTSGWSAREQTFINGVQLSDTGFFVTPSASAFEIKPAFLTNPYSAEVIYTINSVGIGGFNGGIDMSVANVAVPLPLAGAGLPGLVTACLGLFGFHWRRRRRESAMA